MSRNVNRHIRILADIVREKKKNSRSLEKLNIFLHKIFKNSQIKHSISYIDDFAAILVRIWCGYGQTHYVYVHRATPISITSTRHRVSLSRQLNFPLSIKI